MSTIVQVVFSSGCEMIYAAFSVKYLVGWCDFESRH